MSAALPGHKNPTLYDKAVAVVIQQQKLVHRQHVMSLDTSIRRKLGQIWDGLIEVAIRLVEITGVLMCFCEI